MTADQPVERLHAALAAHGIATSSPAARSAFPTLQLAHGPVVWRGPEQFRWQDLTTRRRRRHPITDPAEATDRLSAEATMAIP
ncbi:hypothetical protein HS048_36265 [Planomonospora sp. ID91781]|uniref:hypothetical protein n=1 Tax=Planomonospora sp. ID91781 TaxID=2738135 RepID=UPI0018C3E05B|nr:hypothetical protein [Planomonospora sp. ID91781]MBG0826124.1 hypothetical protein [Planomonospora sp. ID91781]